MRRWISTSTLFALVACAAPPAQAPRAVDAPAPTRRDKAAEDPAKLADPEISVMLDDWHAAASVANEARYFGHFASYGVFLGTDGTERWTVPELLAYARPRFATGKAWSFQANHREITMRGDVAWFDEDLGTEKLGPARGSGVVVREGGAWKIAQYNLSIPIPNERFEVARTAIDGRAVLCPKTSSDQR